MASSETDALSRKVAPAPPIADAPSEPDHGGTRSRARFALPLGIFLLMAVLLGIGLTLDPKLVPSPLIDKPMPAFNAPVLADPDRSIADADLLGRVGLVNVWASWCTACLEEHPVLMRLAASRDTPIFGLNYKDERDDALGWLARLGDPYRDTLVDRNGRIGIEWGVYGVPETFVIDARGIIRYKHIGPISDRQMREKIQPLLDALEAEAQPG